MSVNRTLLRAAANVGNVLSPVQINSMPIRLPPLPSLRELMKLYKLSAIKQLSQNFLLDQKLTNKIVKAAGNINGLYVCEVGPGPGGITRSIVYKGAKKIVVIEKDKRFNSALNLLKDACPAGAMEIYWGDVLSFEMSKMFPQELKMEWMDKSPMIHIMGNLPFNIATPLIIRWLRAISEERNVWSFGRVPLTLTFQQEVAERLVSECHGVQRSRLSIMAQYLCHVSLKFTIPGSAFVPKPDVDVGVVKFVPRKIPLIHQPFPLVEKVVRQTFCMRNKFCRRGVSTLFPEMVRISFTENLFSRTNIHPETRPMQLTIEDFSNLCNAYAEICTEHPCLRDYNYRGFKPDEYWELANGSLYESYRVEKKATELVQESDSQLESEYDDYERYL